MAPRVIAWLVAAAFAVACAAAEDAARDTGAADGLMSRVVSPKSVAQSLTEHWSPVVVGGVDDSYIKVAKVQGSLAWHSHEHEDEVFYILKGSLKIEIENSSTVELDEGQMYVVPKGVRHNPIAEEECHILLIERKTTRHTGDDISENTSSVRMRARSAPQGVRTSAPASRPAFSPHVLVGNSYSSPLQVEDQLSGVRHGAADSDAVRRTAEEILALSKKLVPRQAAAHDEV